MDLGLRDKHAVVTGGSLGIGKAIARELAREGADVAIVARTKERLDATARELAADTGRRIIPLAADVTSKAQVDAMVAQAAAQLGGLHILVNSGSPPGGSATATGPIETVVDEDLLHDFNVKYVGALRCARAAELGIAPEDVEKRDFADDSPRGNAIGRMVDAAEIAYLTVFLASDKAWAVTGELVVATGGAGRAVYY
jgi:NAD(P)-dependent dehydrogenase (short-subunit alcohol dehydrogenase family)